MYLACYTPRRGFDHASERAAENRRLDDRARSDQRVRQLIALPALTGVGAHVLEGDLRCVDERDQHVGLTERGIQAEYGKVIRHPDVVRVDGQGKPAAVDVGTA